MAEEEPRLVALGRIPGGLFILATRDAAGAETGMLVSWVQQASFSPPAITVAIGAGRPALDRLPPGGCFTLSILGEHQGRLMSPFFKPPAEGQSPFAGLAVHRPGDPRMMTFRTETPGPDGGEAAREFLMPDVERPQDAAPALMEAHAFLDARVLRHLPAGDHVLVLAEVVSGAPLADLASRPAVHVRKTGRAY
jgi:flavin reductase (DIM6/NTAB) family NADH-FMN oxidoreductase RutF